MKTEHTPKEFYYFHNHGDDEGNNSLTIVYGNEEEDNENAEHFIITCEDTEEDAQECCKRLNSIVSINAELLEALKGMIDANKRMAQWIVNHEDGKQAFTGMAAHAYADKVITKAEGKTE